MIISLDTVRSLVGNDWASFLYVEFNKPYFYTLINRVAEERLRFNVYPKKKDVFNALKLTPFDKIKVVILGQDPYFTPNTAHGFAFSTNNGVIPPSLRNIYNEIEEDTGEIIENKNGNLEYLAEQGVLLLNSVLTVREGEALSHGKWQLWQQFTESILFHLVTDYKPIVFLLWGNYAKNSLSRVQKYANKNKVFLYTSHPSPLSVNAGFKGCKHFTKTNEHLVHNFNLEPINWTKNAFKNEQLFDSK